MLLGALVDAGAPLDSIQASLDRLALEGLRLTAESAGSGAIQGTRVRVDAPEQSQSRDWRAIRSLLTAAPLEPAVRDASLAVFADLAAAEAEVHGVAENDVHFHEVGAVDSIADIVGTSAGLFELGISEIASYPVATGSGWVRSEHGLLPVPAPATASLLARTGVPVRPDPPGPAPGELLTPTGAAVLGALADWTVPPFTPERVAYGFGARELPWPNALRLWIGETSSRETMEPDELLLETNIDDMNPQFYEPLSERLFAAGALDVWLTPVVMKKGRPGIVVSAIVPPSRWDEVVGTIIRESTSFGVRATPIQRVRASRRFEVVATRWGDVHLKLRGWKGRVVTAAPEYDDCLQLSRQNGVPIREVWAEANRLGEVFVGQRWTDQGRTLPTSNA
jgi:pyridinium-3,5-bisthiocarboxylic acid mononucleotide nickel chelatase